METHPNLKLPRESGLFLGRWFSTPSDSILSFASMELKSYIIKPTYTQFQGEKMTLSKGNSSPVCLGLGFFWDTAFLALSLDYLIEEKEQASH